jgi:putative hydrolase of the HAD superfamily
MIKAIVFDCFDVLYVHSSEPYFAKFPKQSQELYELRRQADYGLLDREQYLQGVGKLTGDPVETILKVHQTQFMPNTPLIDAIRNELHDHYKIGMLTNLGRGWLQDFFDDNQLHNLFHAVIVSGEVRLAKPAPEAYYAIAEKLGVQTNECIFVDNDSANCAGAQRVGMWAVHYQTFVQAMADLKNILASNIQAR